MARRRNRKGRPVNGWVILDKPVGVTSTDAVSRVRKLYDAQKAGHAGTLDPLASGILPLALGEATKVVAHVMDSTKAYDFTVRWGEERDTDDREGTVAASAQQRPERRDAGKRARNKASTAAHRHRPQSCRRTAPQRAQEGRIASVPQPKAPLRVDRRRG